MTWQLRPTDRFAKALTRLSKADPVTARRVAKALQTIATLDDPGVRCKPLTGPLAGLWRLRVGDYRVILDIHRAQLTLIALDLGHRSTVYE